MVLASENIGVFYLQVAYTAKLGIVPHIRAALLAVS